MSVPFRVGDFEIHEEIGKSLCGSVRRGIHSQSRKNVAIKILEKSKFQTMQEITRLQLELHLHMKLQHPLISQMFGYYEDENNYYLLIEYSENGTLLQHINKNGPIIEQLARRYFTQLLIAVEYLHTVKRIAHRDIKLENILFDSFYNIRLTDFGISRDFEENAEFHTICGSPSYLAPEIIKGEPYNTKSDIWGMGVVLYSMVNGKLPFNATNKKDLFNQILKEDIKFNRNISDTLKDLINKMLNKNQYARISLEQIKEHPWFSMNMYQTAINYLDCLEENQNDQAVRAELDSYQIDTSCLMTKIYNEQSDSSTIAYKLLKKEYINKDLRCVFRNRASRTSRFSAEYAGSNLQQQRVKLSTANKPRSQVFDSKNPFPELPVELRSKISY